MFLLAPLPSVLWGFPEAAHSGRALATGSVQRQMQESSRLLLHQTRKGLCKNVSHEILLTKAFLFWKIAVFHKNVIDINMYGFIIVIFKGITI